VELTLHKINFTVEAVHDYEFDLFPCNEEFNENDTDWREPCIWETPLVHFYKVRNELKNDFEEYIQRTVKLHEKQYFRLSQYDDQSSTWLMFFIKRGSRIGAMQIWNVVGINDAYYWDEDDEEEGRYREWYNTSITELPTYDWVEIWRHEQKIKSLEVEFDNAQERRLEIDEELLGKRGTQKLLQEREQNLRLREQLKSDLRVYEERLRELKITHRILGIRY